jgi:hypothetical protein
MVCSQGVYQGKDVQFYTLFEVCTKARYKGVYFSDRKIRHLKVCKITHFFKNS